MIDRELTEYQKKVALEVPELYRQQYIRALTKGGKADLINAMCGECCGWEDLKVRIPECAIERCPLWAVRKGANTKTEVKRLLESGANEQRTT